MQSTYSFSSEPGEFNTQYSANHPYSYFVQQAVNTSSNDKLDGKSNSALLSRLATQTHDRGELRDQTLAILFAGR